MRLSTLSSSVRFTRRTAVFSPCNPTSEGNRKDMSNCGRTDDVYLAPCTTTTVSCLKRSSNVQLESKSSTINSEPAPARAASVPYIKTHFNAYSEIGSRDSFVIHVLKQNVSA